MKTIRAGLPVELLETLESRILMTAAPVPFDMSISNSLAHQLSAAVALRGKHTITMWVGGKPSSGSTTTLAAPTNLGASAVSATQVNLSWAVSAGAAGYYVYRSTNNVNFSKIATVNSGSATSYADGSVAGSTTYYYYLVAFKKGSQSGKSAVVSATTPAPPPPTVPTAPTGLGVTSATGNSIGLGWTDTATNATGYYVYRSTDDVTFTLVATLGSSSTGYTDSGLSSGSTYWYEVGAYNTAGEADTAAVSGTTTTVTPSTAPINISTRYGDELVLAGNGGNDSIFVTQSGATLTIVGDGITSTAAVPAAGLFIYSYGGNTTITVDSSVTIRTTVETIDGAGTTITSGGSNVSAWIDSTDGFSGSGTVHKVAGFYGGVSKAIGIRITDPSDAGSTFVDQASLWGTGPVPTDVNQGGVGDCYFVSSLAAFAQSSPAKLEEMAVDMGDGTFAVQYQRGGTSSFVRVDNDISSGAYWGYAYAHPGASGSIWAMIMEKSYAWFRSGVNTYASLDGGWMSAVYSDYGIANTNVSLSTTDNSLFTLLSNDLAAGKPVTFATYSSGTTLVSNHAYTLMSVANVGGVNYYTVRNPWGFSGDSLEDGGGIAVLTFSQMVGNFQLGTAAV